MDYLQAFAISASGLQVEKTRLDVAAANLANAHSTRAPDGTVPAVMRVLSAARTAQSFESHLTNAGLPAQVAEAHVVRIVPTGDAPRLVYEPGHPQADERGFVAYPGVNPVNEMVGLISTLRAYQAGLAAIAVARTMALKALDIGGGA